MAEKRMFSKKITDSDSFIELSSSAQALYFHLNQCADDDGFNNQIQNAMFKSHATIDDLRVLMMKNFIIRFDSGVLVIKHWRIHNTLRKDRYTPTNFQEELSILGIKDNGSYTLLNSGCQVVAKRLPQNSIDKISKEEIIYGQNSEENINELDDIHKKQFEEFYNSYPRKVKKQDVENWFKINKPDEELYKTIIDKLEKFKICEDWKKDNRKYIPYPSNWLNEKRWEDEINISNNKYSNIDSSENTNYNLNSNELYANGR